MNAVTGGGNGRPVDLAAMAVCPALRALSVSRMFRRH